MDSDDLRKPPLIGVGLVITLATGVGYVFVYSVQVGQRARVCIPMAPIRVTPSDLIAAATLAILLIAAIYFLTLELPARWFHNWHVLEVIYGIFFVLAFLDCVNLFSNVPHDIFDRIAPWVLLVISLVGLGLLIVARVIFHVSPFGRDDASLASHLAARYGTMAACLLPLAFLLICVGYEIGYKVATWGPFSYVNVGTRTEVVLAEYDEYIYAASVDWKSSTVRPIYHIYKLGDTTLTITQSNRPLHIPYCSSL
jgi:hypothetical protein